MDNENRTVESANETKEEVMANLGLSTPEVKVQKSDSASKAADENIEESETSNTDEEQEDVTDDDGNKEEQAKGKKQGGFQKKINKLTGRATAAEQRAAFLETELQKLKGSTLEQPKAKPEDSSKPLAENFESHSEYIEALTDWKLEEREKKAVEKKQEETAISQAQSKAELIQSKINEFAKEKTDYHEVISDVDDIMVQGGLIGLIIASKNAPLLNYELAKNREELERINALPFEEAAVELFRFESKLLSSSEQKTEKKEIKTTSASRPLKPVGSASKANLNDSPYEKEMDYQEFKAWSAKQKR